MAKHTTVTISVTEQEKAIIKARASAQGLTINAYCKQILLSDISAEQFVNLETILAPKLFEAILHTLEMLYNKDFSKLIVSKDKSEELHKLGYLKTSNPTVLTSLAINIHTVLFGKDKQYANMIDYYAIALKSNKHISSLCDLQELFGFEIKDIQNGKMANDSQLNQIAIAHKFTRESLLHTGYTYDKLLAYTKA